MRRTAGCVCAVLVLFNVVASVAQTSIPAYTGVWKLDLKRSRLETKHPPSASTATIRYDGKTWNFSRTHHFLHKPADTWGSTMIVDAKEPRITREPPVTITARVTRQGDEIVLREDYAADTGEKASNTGHYRLEDGGNTLIEDEQEITPDGKEHNVWVLTRITK
jgi:hypothetical protein